MRKTLLLAAFGMFVLFACKQTSVPATEQNTDPSTLGYVAIDSSDTINPKQLVTHSKSDEWAQAYWKAMVTIYGKDSAKITRGFLFRTSDLLAALGLKGSKLKVSHIYGRFGLDSANQPKIFFVGVTGANLDTVPMNPGKFVYFKKTIGGKLGDGGDDYVLDLNYPCPTLCPEGN
jgi:hypothetical protein